MSELVYVIGSKEKGSPFKIGKSSAKHLKKRINSLQTGNPLSLKSFYEFTPKDGDAYFLESKIRNGLINKFGYKKLKGEWIESSHKNSVEKIGDDISSLLQNVDYNFEDDPKYKALVQENHKLNHELTNKYDDLIQKHARIFKKLEEFNDAYNVVRDLHVKQKNIVTKISKYRNTNFSDEVPVHNFESMLWEEHGNFGEVYVNAMNWFISIYKMVSKKAYPDLHHKQGYSLLELPKDGFIHITFDNERYTYDIKKNRLSYERPRQYEQPHRFFGSIAGKHYIDKADMYRYYDNENKAFHDDINLKVDKEFENTTLKSCSIRYNNKVYNFVNEDFLKNGKN